MSFLMNTWYVAAHSSEVGRAPLARMFLDQKVVMYRGQDGVGHALGNICPHRFAYLSKGKLVGDEIECPYHGLRFDTNGRCVFNPHGDGKIPPPAKVKSYPFVERYGVFWIWMGAPAKAIPDTIPDFSALANETWATVYGGLEVAANYLLIVDNLMDLSHIQFLHPMLSNPEWVKKRQTSVSAGPATVHCTNRAKNIGIFPIDLIIKPDALRVGEEWLDLRWTAPSNVFLDVRYMTANEEMLHPIGHFLTPATRDRTHYFFRSSRNHGVSNAELSEQIGQQLKHAFSVEDEPIIEDQQVNLGDVDLMSAGPVFIQSDQAAIAVRRTFSQLISQEARETGGTAVAS